MRAAPRAAFVFAAALAACGKGAHYSETDPARGIPAQSVGPAPDGGGADGGPDGGTFPDGGPITCGPSRSDLLALDGCATNNPLPTPEPASLIRSSCNNALFFTSSGTTCSGTISGPIDVFAGKCTISNGVILSCGAPDGILPGVITCLPNNCTIRVCVRTGQDGGC